MNTESIRKRYCMDESYFQLVGNAPYQKGKKSKEWKAWEAKARKYISPEAEKKASKRLIERSKEPGYGTKFVDTNFAIVDAKNAMKKAVEEAKKNGYSGTAKKAEECLNAITALYQLFVKEGKLRVNQGKAGMDSADTESQSGTSSN